MRFNVKSLLAATVYVALAAAASGMPSAFLATFVWTLAIVAALYAAILVVNATGERRWRATGFAAFVAAYIAAAFANYRLAPGSQLFELAGYMVESRGTVFIWLDDAHTKIKKLPDLYASLRAANAVCAMAAGLVGYLLGGLAFRRGQSSGERLP